MDLVTELVQQSAVAPPVQKVLPRTEPIYGMPQTMEGGAQNADLFAGLQPTTQRFADPVAAAPKPTVAPEPAPVLTAPVVEEVPIQSVQPIQRSKQVFSEYNPLGMPPPGLKPSISCMKCAHFCALYTEESYRVDRVGHCHKFDFPCMAGYTCDEFESIAERRNAIKAEEASEQIAVSMYSEKTDTEKLLDRIELGEVTTTEESSVVEQVKEVLTEPEVPAAVEEPKTEVTVKEEIEPTPVILSETNDKKDDINKKDLQYSDKELYSEAIELTNLRFKVPDSSIARSFCKQKYRSLYRAKYGSLENAFEQEPLSVKT
jgi:hypothetical protein